MRVHCSECSILTVRYRILLTSISATLQCLDAVGWAAGRASGLVKTDWWSAGVVVCLERGAGCLHMVQLMPLPLTVSCSSKIQLGFIFWYRLTQVVPERGPLNVCVCVTETDAEAFVDFYFVLFCENVVFSDCI